MRFLLSFEFYFFKGCVKSFELGCMPDVDIPELFHQGIGLFDLMRIIVMVV